VGIVTQRNFPSNPISHAIFDWIAAKIIDEQQFFKQVSAPHRDYRISQISAHF